MQTSLPEPPFTRASLAADFATLGVKPGMNLLLHASLASVGWTVGGAETVLLALLDALGPEGTLMTPTFSGDLTDPATWVAPPAPETWFETIRANVQPFHRVRTPTLGMGAIAESFRTWPGVLRSRHPVLSFAAGGPNAQTLLADQALDWGVGRDSPLERLYELDGYVLLLGVGHDRNSSLHYAEFRTPARRTKRFSLPVERDGRVVWEEYDEVADDLGRLFPLAGAGFERLGGVAIGQVGRATARLMSQPALVDFATPFLEEKLLAEAQQG